MKLYLFRHGEYDRNSQLVNVRGIFDPPLSSNGRVQAGALESRLQGISFARLYSSDFTRALETAALLEHPLKCETRAEPALREIFSTFSEDQVEAAVESLLSFLRSIPDEAGHDVALVTHGTLIQYLVCYVLGMERTKRVKLGPVKECGITVLQRENDIFKLLSYNA